MGHEIWFGWLERTLSPFCKYAIFAKIATFQRATLPTYLNFCLQFGDCRHFWHFCQIRHLRQNRHFPKGPFAIAFEFLFTVWRLIAISAVFANACISGHISLHGFGQNFKRTNFYLCNPFIQTTSRSTLFCSKTCTYPPALAGSV